MVKCKCLNCNKIYDDEVILENGEVVIINCPCCEGQDKLKPYFEKVGESTTVMLVPRKILHG